MPPNTNFLVAGEAKQVQINALMDVTGYTLKFYVQGPSDGSPRQLTVVQDGTVKTQVNTQTPAITDFPVAGTYNVELIILSGAAPLKSLQAVWTVAPALA